MFVKSAAAFVLFDALLVIAACGPATLPPKGPNTAWPCGYHGHSCGNGFCCGDYEDCGMIVSSCPAHFCCYNGEDAQNITQKRGHRPQFLEDNE